MAITYQVNGIEIHGVKSNWKKVPKRKNTDGSIDFQDWALNIWSLEQQEMTAYETVQLLSGLVITSLDTNDIDNRNTGKQYTSVELGSVNCTHIGRRATNITLEFRVDIT